MKWLLTNDTPFFFVYENVCYELDRLYLILYRMREMVSLTYVKE